ncbi:hypothetical protein ABZ464_18740 [Streptomyces sp. NPDC005820]|uniref:hypothetical protein n=1 Tax=Streptomyces sp. NPDC005820 TaxID=3157069 RepID=UPI0033E63DE5
MPFPLVPRARSGPRRRTLLASAAGAALLVGCSSGSESSEEVASGSPSVTERARARAAEESGGLLARYDAVLAAHPALAKRLGPLRAEVVRHVEAFGGAGRTPAASPSAPIPSVSAPIPSVSAPTSSVSALTPSVSALTPSVSALTPSATSPSGAPTASAAAATTEKDALAGLAAAERELADRRTSALVDVPGELARLLASVAAAGAAHAYLLTEGTR